MLTTLCNGYIMYLMLACTRSVLQSLNLSMSFLFILQNIQLKCQKYSVLIGQFCSQTCTQEVLLAMTCHLKKQIVLIVISQKNATVSVV
jgi:hypothetical protein